MNYLRLSILPLLAFATSLSASVTLINDTFDAAALAVGYTTRSTTDWTKGYTSAWERNGALVNTSTVNSTVSEGAVGYVIAVSRFGRSNLCISIRALTQIAVGMTSFELWLILTSSLALIFSFDLFEAKLAMTSLAFILVLVPDPV